MLRKENQIYDSGIIAAIIIIGHTLSLLAFHNTIISLLFQTLGYVPMLALASFTLIKDGVMIKKYSPLFISISMCFLVQLSELCTMVSLEINYNEHIAITQIGIIVIYIFIYAQINMFIKGKEKEGKKAGIHSFVFYILLFILCLMLICAFFVLQKYKESYLYVFDILSIGLAIFGVYRLVGKAKGKEFLLPIFISIMILFQLGTYIFYYFENPNALYLIEGFVDISALFIFSSALLWKDDNVK
jgi:hypothetical protein